MALRRALLEDSHQAPREGDEQGLGVVVAAIVDALVVVEDDEVDIA